MTGSCAAVAVGGAKKKRKLTPYNKFVKKMYAELHKKFSSYTAPEIMKKIGEEWRKKNNK